MCGRCSPQSGRRSWGQWQTHSMKWVPQLFRKTQFFIFWNSLSPSSDTKLFYDAYSHQQSNLGDIQESFQPPSLLPPGVILPFFSAVTTRYFLKSYRFWRIFQKDSQRLHYNDKHTWVGIIRFASLPGTFLCLSTLCRGGGGSAKNEPNLELNRINK